MSAVLRVGISPCPNDTFAFHGLLAGRVDRRGLELDIVLRDVETLNEDMAAGRLDLAKVSFHAALALHRDVLVLPSGSALGFGVGPVVLAARPGAEELAEPRVLCPGRWTTAHLLWRLFHPGRGRVDQALFSSILPALEAGTADLGVCIHEARFTYTGRGLRLVEDLGATWEEATGEALPLGGIVGRRALGNDVLGRFQEALADSLAWAQAHPGEALETMRAHAQEHDDAVLWKHVELYVNAWTRDLGEPGRRALAELARRARETGLVPPDARALELLG